MASEGAKLGHWTFDDSPTKKGKRKEVKDEQEDERLLDQEDNAIFDAIPDISALQEEELTSQIAAPPSAIASRMSTFMQLNKDLQRHAGLFTSEDGIDLSLLAATLTPEVDILEDDNVWTFDTLFTEMSSDIESIWSNATEEEKRTTVK